MPGRKKLVVVGLGMVGSAFIEKVLKLDAQSREYDIVVIGEEPYLAYNRVGLTTYFEHRRVESLYLNPKEWYQTAAEEGLSYFVSTRATDIDSKAKTVTCSIGQVISYDVLVLATGSDALLPTQTPGHDATGVFVYRTIDDLTSLIDFADGRRGTTGAVIGGGLLGLEAAKAMMDLECYDKVQLVERNSWVLSRQLDEDAGSMVVEQVRQLGLDVLLRKRVAKIEVDPDNNVQGLLFEDGERISCSTVCFAIGIRPRDDLARKAGIECAERGGGVLVGDDLATSEPDIYAIGECANWHGQTFGLIAPGVEMADVLSFNLTQAKLHQPRRFKRPDLSTKLKLLGVDVASFGDFFADRDRPQYLPPRVAKGARSEQKKPSKALTTTNGTNGTNGINGIGDTNGVNGVNGANGANSTNGISSSPPTPVSVKALAYRDPFQKVYKKYLFTEDGKYLLGGMMIGDTSDYVKLVPMVKSLKELDVPPGQLILGAKKDGDDDDDLPDDTQVCSCHNVTKGDVIQAVKEGGCKSIGDVKSCTKAGTGCGGCLPLVTTIFNKTMAAMGNEVKNHLCPHFKFSRADLYNIVMVKRFRTFQDVMRDVGNDRDSSGCEVCKPAIGSILSSLWNKHVMDRTTHGLQDTNDRFLGNIQRNGTYSVVPRMAGGEVTPEKLVVIGKVAAKYNLYTKITGGQRIDMFGARKQDLPDIWRTLVEAGMESGHAYAKSLRTVKSCVGTTWCRYGVGDSVGMAVRLEERYKSIRAPHKIKGGVSGCVRECAEAQNKDFGLIATEKGFNVFVGGNGGANPKHGELLAKDVPPADVIPILDRYLMFYIRTADKLQRTARWLENLPGGLKYLQEVVLEDKLGICASLEAQMQELVDSFFDEWAEAIKSPDLLERFRQFANTDEGVDVTEVEVDRGQQRPVYWAKDAAAKEDFKGLKNRWSSLAWQPILEASYFAGADEAPNGLSAAVKRGDTQLAVWRIRSRYYATQQMCPHKRVFALSDGLIGEDPKPTVCDGTRGANGTSNVSSTDGEAAGKAPYVSCPFHKRNFDLTSGDCRNDAEMSIATFEAEERDDGMVYVKLPPVEELDAALGTTKWMVRKGESGEHPFAALDAKVGFKGRRGRKPGVQPLGPTAVRKPVTILAGGGCGAAPDW